MKKNELNILVLEDEPLDVELIKAQLLLLEEYICLVNCTADKESYLKALQLQLPDIILSDYNLPQYNGLEALNDLKSLSPLIPFIFVTGTIDEETAAGTIKAGAWDYVVKDRLFRLPLAVRAALQLKDERMNTAFAEARNQQLSMALEQSPAHIVISDKENIIEYVNARFTEVTGYLPDEIIGKNIINLVPDDKREEYYNSVQKDFMSTDIWRGEFQSIKKDGSLFWESISVSPLKNDKGETTHFITIKEDITQRKKLEQDITEARDRAEKSDKLKDAFLQNLSHEIRTPLNAIVGFSDLLSTSDGDISESAREYTAIIKRSSNQLLSIVSDVLTMSRIQTGQEKVINKPVNISKLVDDLFNIYQPDAERKNLKLFFIKDNPKKELHIITDETKLTQILTNLIDNALKYTNAGSIELTYRIKSGNIEFYVKDTGIGIEKEAQDYIFERFRQAESAIRANYGGTGLGLSISKSFAEMLQGYLTVESERGTGTTFTLSVPYIPEEIAASSEKPVPLKLNKPFRTILIAEDEINNYLLLQAFLRSDKLNLLHAENGYEAVKMCETIPDIDMVLMDIKMPVMDGIVAFREIRKLRNNLPVIAQTAYALEKEKRQILEMGFNGYIAKPIIKDELLRIINGFFSE